MRYATRIALTLLIPATALCLQGCAWFLLGGAGFAAYTVAGSAEGQSNRTPYAQAYTPARSVVSPVTIGYRLFDPDSDACSVEMKYSTDGVTYHSAATAAGSPGVTGLASGPDGTDHAFLWDWSADLGAGLFMGVIVSVTPTDARGLRGTAATSSAFVLGNSAPSVAVNPINDAVKGIILVVFTLTDATSDNVDLSVQYSTDGAVYHDCDIVIGGLSGALSSPGGAQHTIAWDSESDGVAQDGTETNVTVRITPVDEFGMQGSPATTAPFRIGNVKPRTQIVYQNWGLHANPVEIRFLMIDAEADQCALTVEYSVDGGRTWGLAALVGSDNPTSPMASSPSGQNNSFIWDFAADNIDISGPANNGVLLRLTPGDDYNALGQRSLVQFGLGYDFLSPEIEIAPRYSWPYESEKSPSASFDGDGRLHIAWYSTLTTPAQLKHRVRGQGGELAATVTVPTPGGAVSDPRIAGTTGSKIHLVWVEATATAFDVYYKSYDSGAWDAANVNLSDTATVASTSPVVASDPSGNAHVLWVEAGPPDRLMYSTNSSGSWSTPADVTPLAETANVLSPEMAIDASGGIHVVYANGTGVFSFSKDGSSFETSAFAVSGSDSGTMQRASITVDPAGVRTVVYALDLDLRFARFDQSWSAPLTAAGFQSPISHCTATAGQDGVVHAIAILGSLGSSYTGYMQYAAGAWSSPKSPQTSREGDGRKARICMDSSGVPFCVWSYIKNWMTPTSGPEGGILVNRTDQRWIGFFDLATAGSGESFGHADIASGPSFTQHAVFASTGANPGVRYRKFDGAWSSAVKVNGSSTEIPEGLTVAAGSGDAPHVLWVEPLSGTKRVFHSAGGAGGFSAPAAVSSSDGDAADPDLAADSGGDLHAVWVQDESGHRPVWYSRRTASNGSWSTPAAVSQADGICSSPSLALDSAGGIHVAYSRHTGSAAASEIWLVSNATGSWSAPDKRSGATYLEAVEPNLCATGSGANLTLDLVWSADGDNADRVAWYSEFSGGAWGAQSKVSSDDYATDIWCRPVVMRDAGGSVHVCAFIDYTGWVNLVLFELKHGIWVVQRQHDQGSGPPGWIKGHSDGGGRLQFLLSDAAGSVAYRHRR